MRNGDCGEIGLGVEKSVSLVVMQESAPAPRNGIESQIQVEKVLERPKKAKNLYSFTLTQGAGSTNSDGD